MILAPRGIVAITTVLVFLVISSYLLTTMGKTSPEAEDDLQNLPDQMMPAPDMQELAERSPVGPDQIQQELFERSVCPVGSVQQVGVFPQPVEEQELGYPAVIRISGFIWKNDTTTLNTWYRFNANPDIPLNNPGAITAHRERKRRRLHGPRNAGADPRWRRQEGRRHRYGATSRHHGGKTHP